MGKLHKYTLILLFLLPLGLFAQITVKGAVKEQNTNLPLPGVNIVVKGTNIGAATDFDGLYSIDSNIGDTLIFTSIGFTTQEVVVTSELVNLFMVEDSAQLDEVIVIGYGTTTKADATGSVDVISSDDFNKGAIVSSDQLLSGKIAGVRITSAGGQPDAAPNIRIRGGASLNAKNDPLIVIDGVPIDNTNPAGVSNPLSLINPNDIESFSVLKDASATAIYGSRASNGVLIITTKKGTSGETKFSFSTNVSVSDAGSGLDIMNAANFTRFIQEYHPTYTNLLGIDDPSTEATDDLATPAIEGRILADTNWQDAIYRTALSTDNNFSVRTNLFNKMPARFSLGYNRTEGVVRTNDYERYSLAAKLTPKFLDDHLKIDFNIKTLFSDKNAIDEGGALGGALAMDPTKPIYDNSASNRFGGFYNNTKADNNRLLLDGQSNPLALLMQRTRPEEAFKILGNIEFDYKMHFLPELRAVLNLGLETSKAKIEESYADNAISTYRFNNDDPNIDTNYVFNPGINYSENQNIINTLMDAYLVYTKQYDDSVINNFDVQGGYSYQNFKNDGNKEIYQYNIDSGLREIQPNDNNPNNRYYTELNLQSFFGRANINILDKYLVTASIRADASSLFRKDERWGYFPAAAIAWKLKNEAFLKDVSFVNNAKVRLGWGKTGQQDITGDVGYYPSRPLFTAGSNQSQYLPGVNLYSANAFNDQLTWEKTTTYNAGIDFDFFKNSLLTGSFDIYKRKTTDLLAKTNVPPGQSLSDTFVQNVGTTEGEGFEIGMVVSPIQTQSFSFDFNLNAAYNRTEVTDLEGSERIISSGGNLPIGTGVNLAYHAVGYQPHSAWVFKQLYDQNNQPIFGAFADTNGDNVIDNDDRYYQALRPNWTYGFGLNFTYKNWDLNSSFRGQVGGYIYNSARLVGGYTERALPNNNNSLSNVLDFYSGAANPAFDNVNGNVKFSDYFLEESSFLRCDNIVLGYRVPNFLKNSSLRVYGAVNNAFIITDYSGQDPENFNSIDNNFYPRPRVYTIGLNLDF